MTTYTYKTVTPTYPDGLILIEHPHRGNVTIWHANDGADFISKVSASAIRKDTSNYDMSTFQGCADYLAHGLDRLRIVFFDDFEPSESLNNAAEGLGWLRIISLPDDLAALVNKSELEDLNDLDAIQEYMQERISEQDIIYYSAAMRYLNENDNSLTESLGLAADFGFELKNLNSETLATILYQQNLSEQLSEIEVTEC